MMKIVLIGVIVITFLVPAVLGHSGRTDKYGGHNNRKTGGYHYHNAGSIHAAGNSYQNHNTCGICKSKNNSGKKIGTQKITDEEVIKVLQEGLKCLGYEISDKPGELGSETRLAVKNYLNKSIKSKED